MIIEELSPNGDIVEIELKEDLCNHRVLIIIYMEEYHKENMTSKNRINILLDECQDICNVSYMGFRDRSKSYRFIADRISDE